MNKHLAYLALAGALAFGTGAAGAENQNQKASPAQARPAGNPHANAGGGARIHAQSQGGANISRGNTARVQSQNRITVRGQNSNVAAYRNANVTAHRSTNVTAHRSVTRNRAVTNNRQNLQKQPVQRIGQSKINPGAQKQANGRAVVQISQAQRIHIRDAFRQHQGNFHRVASVGFPIFVGGSVPSDYTFYDVSSDFAEYAPEYDGYKYIVVGDQLLIIDPQTWEIVAVIPV